MLCLRSLSLDLEKPPEKATQSLCERSGSSNGSAESWHRAERDAKSPQTEDIWFCFNHFAVVMRAGGCELSGGTGVDGDTKAEHVCSCRVPV